MSRLRVHVLPEVADDLRPHSSPYVRLIRPLSHPALAERLSVRFSRTYCGEPADVVILDRLWGPWITLNRAVALVRRVRRAGARLIYSLDDNLLDARADRGDWPSVAQEAIVRYLLGAADGVLVSTPELAERLAAYHGNIAVVPNALDERLVVGRRLPQLPAAAGPREPVVIGWMGTRTHDRDLAAIAPALHAIWQRHGAWVRFECVGLLGNAANRSALAGLPVHYRSPLPAESEYPHFMLWFTSRVRWDIGLAALVDSPFTRCKSDLKFLDYAAIGAAGIYSDGPSYATGVRHAETGWLTGATVTDWVESLDRLIRDAPLRASIAAAAERELHTRRCLAVRATDWADGLEALLSHTATAEAA